MSSNFPKICGVILRCTRYWLRQCSLLVTLVAVVSSATAQQATGDLTLPDGVTPSSVTPRSRMPRSNSGSAVIGPTESAEYGDQTIGTEEPADMLVGPSLPAYRIIDILRQQPEMMLRAKELAVRVLRADKESAADQPRFTGQLTDGNLSADGVSDESGAVDGNLPASLSSEEKRAALETRVSDETVFNLIERRADLRAVLTQEMQARSLLTSQDYQSLTRTAYRAELTSPRPNVPRRRSAPREPLAGDQNQPEVTRRWSPYEDLPALRDLYTQFPSQQKPLRRFGADVFRRGTGNLEELPMDLPAGPDYVLGPGDSLSVNVWGGFSRKFTAAVDRSGQIFLPEAGAVVVAGKTLGEARELVQRALNTQFRDVKADVSLARVRTVRVYVVGDVERPGAYDITSLSTPLNAIYAAGGPTPRGSLRQVRHYRGNQVVCELDLYDFLLRGIRTHSEQLQPGDTILVPPVGPQVTVAGMVRRPAIYELKNEIELSEALELAGGVLVSATLRQINVERIEAHQRRTTVSLELPAGNGNQAASKLPASFKVQDGDRITISPILPYSEETIYVQGHVYRPGKYPFRKGMTVGDVIRSYQDLLPEPSEHGEIVRLSPPDYRPMVVEFKLSEVLSNEDPIELQPFDTVRVFGRYEIDAPKVAIYGEVLRPGQYPLAQGTTVTGLLRMAGGFKRSAMRHSADVASYVVQNGERVLTKHTKVDLAKALEGDAGADLRLKPGDTVTIHRLAGWHDIGSAVTLKGEVTYPGTYGIEEGERLSSVLRRAGGFRASAYPAGAVLKRVQVREIEEANRQQLITRIESTAASFKPGSASGQEQVAMLQAMQQQQQQVLTVLRNQPAAGRLVINITANISKWENTPADIELREGDVLIIPKRPNFVVVSGQVYNASAITFAPGKTAEWYLKQAGGATELANKKGTFIVRANGSVIGNSSGGWFSGNALSTRMQPGDSIVVPDKIIGGSMFWKNLMTSAQLMSSIAVTTGLLVSNL
ncbi:MAG: SLBB domain-containing protein [Terriglobales bacterium]